MTFIPVRGNGHFSLKSGGGGCVGRVCWTVGSVSRRVGMWRSLLKARERWTVSLATGECHLSCSLVGVHCLAHGWPPTGGTQC